MRDEFFKKIEFFPKKFSLNDKKIDFKQVADVMLTMYHEPIMSHHIAIH
jgi:hypothetical protein